MSHASQFTLLTQRRFAPFFWTQFLGAFNDNLFKTALIVVLTFDAASWTALSPSMVTNLIPGLFILPYVLFSATAGQVAEKFEKAALVRFIKWAEIAIMGIAAAGWLTHTLWLLILAVFAMGTHSTLFGPVKYSYMPQQLRPEELTGGNGMVEMGTFVGILLGQVFGDVIVMHGALGISVVAGATVGFAVLGLLASYRIPLTPAPAPDLRIAWNPLAETVRNLRHSAGNRSVFLSMLGNSWFWFYGAMVLAQFPVYAMNYLHGDHSVFVLLLTVFSLGIGAGSLLCEKLSGRKVEIGLVPFGSIGLSLFGVDLYFASLGYGGSALGSTLMSPVDAFGMLAQPGAWRIVLDVVLIGVFGGFFIVPLFALIQLRCDPRHLSRTIAGMNILNALFMVAAAGVAILLLGQGLTIPELFLATAIMNALVAAYIFSLVPEFLMRFLAWLLIHTVHKVKVIEAGRIPEEGAAVLVCNHVSYVDAIVIMAASPRPIRFVMDHRIFKTPLLGFIFRTAKAIPIAPAKEDPWLLEKAYVDIAHALHDGELVCIFPEGRLTTTGEINEFKGGIAKIVERSQVPVIPMALRGLWGHLLSRSDDNVFERAFRKGLRSRLALAVGQPVPPSDATPELLQREVLALRGDWK
ncbi:1-acyl-sn-glycerol-3-phosphate acyltransferase [Pseudoduganella flava]|uniref:1-acyl-sn-glycerol-3-phosphate acyltransferase n=1 Tax=Pseudoduganella flava TaxID=871742 RepID=A0A562PTE4_9BURK|nr:MFS transporter [Pseudoduganella flava]QGZ39030.1 MFS transporter [Pseudoduganella flava]TWI47705.1 1-acyl-sn-glycerol-3-phosphate acyltransferase [Pseudoduganella flava]